MSIIDLLTPEIPPASHGPGLFALGVVDQNNDKNFPGKVRVNFTAWVDGENKTQWLPVLTPYAGKNYGRYLIPEIGDIVLVGFMGAMQEQPFVMGSFYPAEASLPGEQFSDKNINRYFKTKGGVQLTILDEDSKQSVTVETPKGLKLNMEDEKETISVTDKGGKNLLNIKTKDGVIEILSDKKITMKTGSCEITMDGQSGALTVKADQLKMEGGKTVNIKSGNMLTAEGGVATMEGKQKLTLKGSAMCEISGGMVKIN